MAKFNDLINTFTGGEVSPRIFGQTRLQGYVNSCEEISNMIVLPQGGAMRRAGTRIPTVDALSAQFDPSFFSSQTYARPIVWVLANGQRLVLIMRPGQPGTWGVWNEASGTTISPVPFPDANFSWTALQIEECQYAQVGDYLVIVHPQRPPTWIYPFGFGYNVAVWWQAFPGNNTDSIEIGKRIPFKESNINNNFGNGSITPSGVSGTITLTSSAGYFKNNMQGTYIKFSNTTSTGIAVITAFTNANTVTASVLGTTNLPGIIAFGTAANTSWEHSAWGVLDGYPKTVAFYENRIYYGGSYAYPNRFWASKIGDYDDLMPIPFVQESRFTTYLEDNSRAFYGDIASNEFNQIQWFSPGKVLAIGTLGREYTLFGYNGAAGPININIKAATSFGSQYTQPVRISNKVMFVQRSGERIRDLTFSFEEDDYKSADLSLLAEHLIRESLNESVPQYKPKIRHMTVTQSPFPLLWMTDTQGNLYSANIDKDIGIVAWSRHTLGGSLTGANRPKVLGICAAPFQNIYDPFQTNAWDDLFLIVQRTINGTTTLSLEVLSGPYWGPSDQLSNVWAYASDAPVFLDFAKRAGSVTPTTTFTGFNHLIGETVQVLADGRYVGDFVVDNTGTITLPAPRSDIIAGLKYTSRIITVPLEFGSRFGTAQGEHKRPHEAFIRFYRTLGAKFGKKGRPLDEIPMRPTDLPMNEATPLFSGTKRIALDGGYEFFYQMQAEQDKPLPFEVTAIVLSGVTYD